MTLQIQLEPELLRKLEQIALERGKSTSDIVVELLTQSTSVFSDEAAPLKTRPSWIGSAESGKSDLGVSTDEYLFKPLLRG